MTGAPEPAELLAAEPAVLTNIRIGYARVSTGGQKLERQLDALNAAGGLRCDLHPPTRRRPTSPTAPRTERRV